MSITSNFQYLYHIYRESYQSLKNKWSEDESRRATPVFQDQKHRIGNSISVYLKETKYLFSSLYKDKDVHRTDRTVDIYADESMPNPDPVMNVGTNKNLEILKCILVTYNEYNTELGYVQGMSDLLSPLYAVMEEEPLAFWAFAGFMERMVSFNTSSDTCCTNTVKRSPISTQINRECTNNCLQWISCYSLWILLYTNIFNVLIVVTSFSVSAGFSFGLNVNFPGRICYHCGKFFGQIT